VPLLGYGAALRHPSLLSGLSSKNDLRSPVRSLKPWRGFFVGARFALSENDLNHARKTGANWGKHAAAGLLASLGKVPTKESAAKMHTAANDLRSRLAAAHGLEVSGEWHRAAIGAVSAGLDPD
jgi:hypothetical protein